MRAQMVGSLVSTCLVAAGVVAQPADALLPPSTETISEVPFDLYQHHLIVTRGSIGRLDGLSLLIDTGSIRSMVDGRIARKLNLQAESSMLVAFGQRVAIQSAVLDGFRIGPMRSGPVPASVGDLSYLEGVRIDAIVGLDVLARTSFSIDYRTRVLRFAPAGREDWSAPLELAWPFLTVRMTIAGQPVRLLVDTGSSDLVVFKTRLPAALSRVPWRGDKTVQYASGAARLQRLDLRQVGLGEHVWDTLEGWTLDRVPQGYPSDIDGVLGVLSLGCTRVRFDFERNELGCSGSLTKGSLATPAAAGDRRDRASRQALAFFEHVGAGRPGTFLDALRPRFSLGVAGGRALAYFTCSNPRAWDAYLKSLRPPPVSADRRARSLTMVRKEDVVEASREQRAKLDALQPILAYLEREGVIEVKLLRPPGEMAWAGFLEGAAVLISTDALDLLAPPELQAVVAHELAHEYFAGEYDAARAMKDYDTVREIELRCDAVAIVTMSRLGLDRGALLSGVAKLTKFNERRGFPNREDLSPSWAERRNFVRSMAEVTQ